MRVKIEKGTAKGEIYAPSSKSDAHRLLISAAMCEGESVIDGVSPCADIEATVRCLRALGANIDIDGERYTVTGTDMTLSRPETALLVGESGSTARFLIPIAALSGSEVTLRAEGRLMQRPFGVFEDIFKKEGLRFEKSDEIRLKGPLRPSVFTLRGDVSSQFISGLLFALPILKSDSVIKIIPPLESRAYIEMTLHALSKFGVRAYFEDALTIIVPGGQKYSPKNVRAEGDYSGAAFPFALNLFGGDVKVLGLNPHSLQSDKAYLEFYPKLDGGFAELDISHCPDLGPVLFALAAAKHGARITGTARLKMKESDRAAAMAEELSKFGARTDIYENEVIIGNSDLHAPNEILCSHGDHRIVMALAILLTVYGGEIDGAEAVAKSYPDFFTHLQKLGIGIQIYDDTQ